MMTSLRLRLHGFGSAISDSATHLCRAWISSIPRDNDTRAIVKAQLGRRLNREDQ